MNIRHALLAIFVAAFLPSVAAAQSFACVTDNTGSCASSVASHLSWSYSNSNLTIENGGPVGSFISGIYFDWGDEMGATAPGSTDSVNFAAGGSPKTLPGTNNNSGFVTDAHWTAENSAAQHGVNGGESITFALSNVSLGDFASGVIRVGIHVQGLPLAGGQTTSESLISVSPVPEPESYAMLLAGLGLIGTIARRRSKGKAA